MHCQGQTYINRLEIWCHCLGHNKEHPPQKAGLPGLAGPIPTRDQGLAKCIRIQTDCGAGHIDEHYHGLSRKRGGQGRADRHTLLSLYTNSGLRPNLLLPHKDRLECLRCKRQVMLSASFAKSSSISNRVLAHRKDKHHDRCHTFQPQ